MQGNNNPSTLAAKIVRIPDPVNGVLNGLKILVDRTNNNRVKFEDEGINFNGLQFPSTLVPNLFFDEENWGFRRTEDTLYFEMDGVKMFEITSTTIMMYASDGNKMIHIDRESGTIYTRGQIETGGLNFPV